MALYQRPQGHTRCEDTVTYELRFSGRSAALCKSQHDKLKQYLKEALSDPLCPIEDHVVLQHVLQHEFKMQQCPMSVVLSQDEWAVVSRAARRWQQIMTPAYHIAWAAKARGSTW